MAVDVIPLRFEGTLYISAGLLTLTPPLPPPPQAATAEGYLNTRDASKYVGLSPSTLYRARKSGHLLTYTVGGRVLYHKADLDDLVGRDPGPYGSP